MAKETTTIKNFFNNARNWALVGGIFGAIASFFPINPFLAYFVLYYVLDFGGIWIALFVNIVLSILIWALIFYLIGGFVFKKK